MSYHHRWEAALRKFELMDKIVICAINGYCLGGGLQLALACDLRIAAASAQLGLPGGERRLDPGFGRLAVAALYRAGARQTDPILSGQLVDAQTAQNIQGLLLDQVVADVELLSHVQATAERYLTVPWLSVLRSKQLTNQAFDQPYGEALSDYFTAQAEAMRSLDHLAAMQTYSSRTSVQSLARRESKHEQQNHHPLYLGHGGDTARTRRPGTATGGAAARLCGVRNTTCPVLPGEIRGGWRHSR